MSEFLKDLRIAIVLENQQKGWIRRIHILKKIPEIFSFPFLVPAMFQDWWLYDIRALKAAKFQSIKYYIENLVLDREMITSTPI